MSPTSLSPKQSFRIFFRIMRPLRLNSPGSQTYFDFGPYIYLQVLLTFFSVNIIPIKVISTVKIVLFGRKWKSARKSVFPVKFRKTVWFDRFLRAWKIQPQRAHKLCRIIRKNLKTFLRSLRLQSNSILVLVNYKMRFLISTELQMYDIFYSYFTVMLIF